MSGKNAAAPRGRVRLLRLVPAVSLLILLLSTALTTAQDSSARHAALAQMCGTDFRSSVQRMIGGQISGEQATDCWCFFWEKAGSNPITMYNGRKAADLCPRRLAQQTPTPSGDHGTVERPGTGTVSGGGTPTGGGTQPVASDAGNQPGTDPRGTATASSLPTTGRPSSPGNPPAVRQPNAHGSPSTVERPAFPSGPPSQVTDARPGIDKPNGPGTDRAPGSGEPTAPPSAPGARPAPANPPRDYAIAPEPAECPQRGKGCAALIIDFSAAIKKEDNLEALSKALSAAGCRDVEYVAPKFIAPADYSTSQEVAAQRLNDGNVKQMTDAIARHRNRVRQGAELVVEIIKGHGVQYNGACGTVIPGVDFTTPAEIPRAGFHHNNYQAVHGNACAWFVADFSCSSGLTPEAIDELNNKGGDTEPACTFKPAEKCLNHAAYEGDIAVGSAKSDTLCTFSASRDFNDTITKALQSAAQGPYIPPSAQPGKPSLMNVLAEATRGMPSVYTDGGRKYCGASRRDGYWLSSKTRKD